MNDSLIKINFEELVKYGHKPIAKYRYDKPIQCSGYCTSCEDAGLLGKFGGELTLMSHGCSTADYQEILGILPNASASIKAPILFLLEDPGSDSKYNNGESLSFNGLNKKPPVNHFYWSPPLGKWPESLTEIINCRDYYGSYFAYLMRRFNLANVYITNLVKCKWIADAHSETKKRPRAIESNCTKAFLRREIIEFGPKIIVSFGNNVASGLNRHAVDLRPDCDIITLLHPSYIKNRSQVDKLNRTKIELFMNNDEELNRVVKKLVQA